jgi:hypothetical protein
MAWSVRLEGIALAVNAVIAHGVVVVAKLTHSNTYYCTTISKYTEYPMQRDHHRVRGHDVYGVCMAPSRGSV